jgi:F420-dependent oxidoreductase-like protein
MSTWKAGLVVPTYPDSRQTLEIIQELDEIGVDTVWQTTGATRPDPLTVYAAVAATTSRIRFGTAIVPAYPRHPGALGSQVLALESLAPGRLRLGIGTSHKPTIEGSLGIPMGKPLSYLREYLTVLRALLDEGKVAFHGEYLNVDLSFQQGTTPPMTEIPISALGEKAFRLAGELADGAISWVAPIPYLVSTGLPALADGAARANRPAPPLIAHVPVAVTSDRGRALEAVARDFGSYGHLPFYANMFAAAGYPVDGSGNAPPEAIESLAVSGTPDQIRVRLDEILAEGLGEVIVSHAIVDDANEERRELAKILATP